MTNPVSGSSFIRPNQVWHLDPRDPVVLGDGRAGVAFVEGGTWPFPYPGTVAGMVRTAILRGETQVSPKAATNLLEHVRIRGPWLLAPQPAPQEGDLLPSSRLYVPAPSDVRLVPDVAKGEPKPDPVSRLLGPTFLDLSPDEGVVWPEGEGHPEPRGLCVLPERVPEGPARGAKLEPLADQFWPLSLAVAWGLGYHNPTARPDGPAGEAFRDLVDGAVSHAVARRAFLPKERRIHVVIQDATGTAEHGLLFSSSGFRLPEGWALGIEVEVPENLALDPGTHIVQLGGEGRLSYVDVAAPRDLGAGAFPGFEPWRPLFEDAARGAAGLRLQLLTPAYLPARKPGSPLLHNHGDPAWCPSWLYPDGDGAGLHPALRDLLEDARLRLQLHSVCLTGHVVVSGWNLQGGRRGPPRPGTGKRERTGAPREVRRLVPAGTVYYLEFIRDGVPYQDREHLAAILPGVCEALWGGVIDPEGPGEVAGDFRAPAASDGYGLVLPGCWHR